jgi:hypothetical protein
MPQKPSKLLFIGNSFTARNDLPGLLAELAAARGITVEHRLLSIGGASLRTHWNKGEAQALISSKAFDFVILQEQSTLPIKNSSRMRENVLLFDDAIRQAGAKTVLYMTWARKQAPDSQRAITQAYRSIGQEINAIVVPVGEAWRAFLAKHGSPVLHDKDQSHPTLAGSYLAACAFLSTIFGQSSAGIRSTVRGLSSEDVKILQTAAREAATTPRP